MPRLLALKLVCLVAALGLYFPQLSYADNVEQEQAKQEQAAAVIDKLQQPLYNPFVERYVLDEVRQLRVDMAAQKNELLQQIYDREHKSVDRAVTYATDTITYFFYLIAAASSVLVLVGWTSIRDIKERVHSLADQEISRITREYEQRLFLIEQQLSEETQHIEQNREEIEITQEIQSLWMRAGQESNPTYKIPIYDQILNLRSDDCEALTYKADAVLEIGEPQWSANLSRQALAIDPQNGHAFYQLACALTVLGNYDEAITNLLYAIERNESYREDIERDSALISLRAHEKYQTLIRGKSD